MDYLKFFTIGTSGLITLQHFLPIAMQQDNKSTFMSYFRNNQTSQKKTNQSDEIPFVNYSFIAPIYYGLMGMLALFLARIFSLSIQRSLFYTSILSIILVTTINYTINRHRYQPYKSYTTQEWIYYILRNGSRHLIAFNLVMFYFSKYFSYAPLKAFIIGSSAFSYLFTYSKVAWLQSLGKVNYNYKLFTVYEPIGHGLLLLWAAFFSKHLFGLTLRSSLFYNSLILPVSWALGVKYVFKTYQYNNQELAVAFSRVFATSLIRYNIVLYLLLKYLK